MVKSEEATHLEAEAHKIKLTVLIDTGNRAFFVLRSCHFAVYKKSVYKFCEETAYWSYTFKLLEEVNYPKKFLSGPISRGEGMYGNRALLNMIFRSNYGNIMCSTVWVFW